MNRIRWVGIVLGLATAASAFSAEPRVDIRTELRALPSFTATDQQTLTGTAASGTPVLLGAELSLPTEVSGRMPAVVLLHGSAGVLPYVTEWRDELARLGIASLVIDSFSGRGISTTIADQDRLGRLNGLVDAYQGLAMLRAHPRIDPDRIAVMGFSRGADVALYSALQRFQMAYGAGGRFAAHVAFYPNCGTRYLGDTAVSPDIPILILQGTADDYVPIGACRDYVKRLKAAGVAVEWKEFDGADHVFMYSDLEERTLLKTGQTTRNCRLEERADGVVTNAASGQPFTHKDPCVELGAHVGYSAAAASQAREAVKRLLAKMAGK